MVTILNGPTGTELIRRGHDLAGEAWSAVAVERAPRTIAAIHAEYAAAGATVHTACTFRTQPRIFPRSYAAITRKAVALCRGAVPAGHRVFGSMAPVGDCYESGPKVDAERLAALHGQMAEALRAGGVDGILCETFPNGEEGLLAVRAACDTGLPVWISLTAGPEGDLMSPAEMSRAGEAAIQAGAEAVLVNCVAVSRTRPYIEALSAAVARSSERRRTPARVGVFANAGTESEGFGWSSPDGHAAERYAQQARDWVELGATIVGSCCGTGPEHTRALARAFAKG